MSTGNGSAQILDDLALAHALADLADAITLERYQSQDLVIITKPDNTPVTDADRAVETAIREALATHRTGDGLVGEEFGSDKGNSGRYWVIDPIDGTKNFMRGVPTWATLIALVQIDAAGNEEVVVGIASAPALARRWAAAKGHGATVRFNGPDSTSVFGDSSDDDYLYDSDLSDQVKASESYLLAPNEKKISVSKVSSLMVLGARAVSVISGHTCWWQKVRSMLQLSLHLHCGTWQPWTLLFAKPVEPLQTQQARTVRLVEVVFQQMAYCTMQ
jgi:fructose-1,6-bisphosphatase/inositol monophosphatase family enzyme